MQIEWFLLFKYWLVLTLLCIVVGSFVAFGTWNKNWIFAGLVSSVMFAFILFCVFPLMALIITL